MEYEYNQDLRVTGLKQKQKTILSYTVPERVLRREMVEKWVRDDLVDQAWEDIRMRSWGE